MAYFSPLLPVLSTKMTLVPACLLIVSMVSCCNTLYMKSRVSLADTPVSLDIWAMLWAHPSVILFLISATPLPLSAFSCASASASNTALILAAQPSFLAACFLLSDALISFIDRKTSSGGTMFLTWELSMVNPPSFILGPTFSIIASAISDWDSKSWSRVKEDAILRTVFSVQEIIWFTGSLNSKNAFAESSAWMRYCRVMSRVGNTLSAVRTCILHWFSANLFDTRWMD